MGDLIVFLVLLSSGYFIGRMREAKHYRSLIQREHASIRMPVLTDSPIPETPISKVFLVTGIAVISSDYFKTFAAGIKSFFGGRLTTYESLLDRARREAVLRMKAQALQEGANMVVKMRLETMSISGAKAGGGRGRGVISVEAIAYGTALRTR